MRSGRFAASLAALGLALAFAAPAAALSKKECAKLRSAWLDKKLQADALERKIHARAKSRMEQKDTATEIADAFTQAREVIGEVDVAKAKKKIDDLRKKLEDQKGKLKEFLDGVSKGLKQSQDVIDKAKKGMKAVEDAISVINANPQDPAAAAKEFANYVGLLNEYLGPLINKVPGLGSFMEFYTKALVAMANAIGKIQKARSDASVKYLGEDIFDPRWTDLEKLRREQSVLSYKIKIGCGKYYRLRNHRWITVAAYERYEREAKAAAARKAAADKEAARVRGVQATCRGLLSELRSITRKQKALADQQARLAKGATANDDPKVAAARSKQAKKLATQSNKLSGEYQKVKRELDLKCGRDAPAVMTAVDTLEAQRSNMFAASNAAVRRTYRTAEITEAKAEIRKCRDECRECHKELKKLEEALKGKQADLEKKRKDIGDKRKEIKDLTDQFSQTKDKAKNFVYTNSSGKLITSAAPVGPERAMGTSANGLTYHGWIISGQAQRDVREAKRKQEKAEKELSDLEQQERDLEKELADARDALRRKREACEACRKECEKKMAALRDGNLAAWMGRLKDDGKIYEEGAAFVREAVDAESDAESTERKATRVLVAGQATSPLAMIPNLGGAAGFSAVFAAGKSAGILGAAASRLGPFAGAFLAGPGAVFRIDPGVLKAMANGERPRPRQNLQPAHHALRTGPQQPGPTRASGGGSTVFAPGGPSGTPVDTGSGGGGAPPSGSGSLGFRSNRPGGGDPGGLITGGATVGTFDEPGGSLPRRTRSGSATDAGIGAGQGTESVFDVLDATRWEVVKERIRQLLSAYVNRDISGVVRVFAPGAWQDLSILRNAIQEDFQNETNVNIDVELVSYFMTFDTVQVRIRVNRNATDQTTGVVSVQSGTATLFFLRHEDLRMAAWFGFTPFGLFDPQWREQARAGDQNAFLDDDDHGSGGYSPMGPQQMSAGPFLVDDPFSSPSPTPDHVFVNFDTGATGTFDQNNTCFASCSQPGFDLVMFGNVPTPGDVSFQVLQGQVSGGSPPIPVFDQCSTGQLFETYGAVDPTFSGSVASQSGASPQVLVLGGQTTNNQHFLVEVTATAVGAQVQFTLRWYVSPDDTMVGAGPDPCLE